MRISDLSSSVCCTALRVDLAVQLAAPVGFLAAALILPAFIVASERPFRGVGLGPTAWPAAMLAFIAVCAAIWLAQELLAWRRGRIVPLATEATPDRKSTRLNSSH